MIRSRILVCAAMFVAMHVPCAVADDAAPLSLPSFGVTVTAPAGWRRLPEANPSHIARWTVDGDDGKPVASIEFSMVAASGRTVGQIAEAIARQHGGKASQSDLRMGDAPTMMVVHEPPEAGAADPFVPRKVYVASHDGQLYMMLLLAKHDAHGGDLDAAAKSVKFSPIASPAVNGLSTLALPLFGADDLSIRLPEGMRPTKSPDPTKQLAYSLTDNRTGQSQLTLLMQGMAKPAELPAAAVAESLAGRLTKQFGLDGPIKFNPPAKDAAVNVWRTPPFAEPANANNRHVIMLVEHGQTQLFLLMFRAAPTDPAEVDAYLKLVAASTDTIAPAAKPAVK